MKTLALSLALLAALPAAGHAARKDYEVKVRQVVLEEGRRLHEWRRVPHGFTLEVIGDERGRLPESRENGRWRVSALRGERYSVRLTNPLPVRVAVNLTVDGLNSIDGKPCGLSNGPKWIVEPYSSVTIPGWQVSQGEARRFFFTEKPKSYAKWRENRTGKELSANCGVIGAAFFWSQADLDRWYDDHPVCRTRPRPIPYSNAQALDPGAPAPACAEGSARDSARAKKAEERAGTGMGEREGHPTVRVDFECDRGMYRLSDALVVYYDFGKSRDPQPFPEAEYAPEMD